MGLIIIMRNGLYIYDLKANKAQPYNFWDQQEKMIRDQLVFHTEQSVVLQKLITAKKRQDVLTLDDAMHTALAHEVSWVHLKATQTSSTT